TFPVQTWAFDVAGASLLCIQPDGSVLRRDGTDPSAASVVMDVGGPLAWSSPQRAGAARLAVARRGDVLLALDLRAGKILRSRAVIDEMDRCQISPEGHLVAHVKNREAMLEWDMHSGKDLPLWQGVNSVSWIAFSRDG